MNTQHSETNQIKNIRNFRSHKNRQNIVTSRSTNLLSSTISLQPLLEQAKVDASSSEVGLIELFSFVDVVPGSRSVFSAGGAGTEFSGKTTRRRRLRSLTNEVVVVENSKFVSAAIFLLLAEGGTSSKSGGGLVVLKSTSITAISATPLHFLTISHSLSPQNWLVFFVV